MDVEPYNFACLVYEELRRRLWPLNTQIDVHPPWTGMTEEQQRLWEQAVERALIRSGVIEGTPSRAVTSSAVPESSRNRKKVSNDRDQ